MSLRICMCCGEPIAEKDNALFRYQNLCASCSSLSDRMSESNMSSLPDFDDKMLMEEVFPRGHGQTGQSDRPQ